MRYCKTKGIKGDQGLINGIKGIKGD